MSFSLLSSINTCKVNTGYADKLQSDRIENPDNMTCFVWNGLDTYGRPVSMDSFYTKAPGCNDALDRVKVENFQRPKYMEYVSLDARGIKGDNEKRNLIEGFLVEPSGNAAASDAGRRVKNYYQITGSIGNDYNFSNTPRISGQSAVNGDPNAYKHCGQAACGRGDFNKGIFEGFSDNRAAQNFQSRQNLSGINRQKSAMARSGAGN